MRRTTPVLALVVGLAAPAAAAQAQATRAATAVPAPRPIVTTLGSTPTVQLDQGGGGLPNLQPSASINAGDLVGALTAYHDSGTYGRQVAQVDRAALRWVRTHVRRTRGGVGVLSGYTGTRKPAIVFDIDETALSNYTAILADRFTYGPASQAEAVNQVGTAIAPTKAVYDLARRRGVAVFFVTGRPEAQRAPTEANLRREGYTGWRTLYLKPAAPTQTTVQYKSSTRAAIERSGYRIVANVGDQYSDLAGGHALRAFKLPNPFYYLP